MVILGEEKKNQFPILRKLPITIYNSYNRNFQIFIGKVTWQKNE